MHAHQSLLVAGRSAVLAISLGMMLAATLSACGKKGPLYLPEEANTPATAAKPAASPPPAGAEEGAHQK